jgi:predicted Zn finger-like uncharacterized protein
MKISCQSCAAKYTIADEKVVGKVIKIKCKKCSATIVVNGNDPAVLAQLAAGEGYASEDQAATQLATRPPSDLAPSNPDEWTVSITDDDQRTMTTAQILTEYANGTLSSDTYVWKDGMGDWLPLQQVPELQPLLAATGNGGYGAPAPAPMHEEAGYGTGGGYDAPAPTPMAATAAAPMAAASTAAKRGSRASVDLFGGGLEEVARPAAPMPPPSLGDKHVGERNETSVLFSLKDLTAAENAAKNTSKGSPFDSNDRIDDILSLGGGGAAPMLAPPPMNAPVIEPPPPPPPSVAPVAAAAMPMQYAMPPQKKSPMPIVFAAIGVAALLGGVVLFVMSGGKDDAAKDKSTSAAETKPAETSKPKETSTPTDTKPTASEPVATAPTTATADTTSSATTTSAPEDPKTATTSKVATNEPNAKTTATADVKKTADAPKEEPKEEPKGAGGDTPFDRGAASAALNGAAGSAKGCKKPDGPTGSAKVQVTFAPSGKATQATVGAPFAGTGVGSCIAGAFKGLKVPPFTGAPVTVSKTVNIK